MKKHYGYLCPWFYNNKMHYLYEKNNKVELVNINLSGRELQDEFEYKLPIQLVRYIYLLIHIQEWRAEYNTLERKLETTNSITKTLMLNDEASDMSRFNELSKLLTEYSDMCPDYSNISKEIILDVTTKLRKSQNNKVLEAMIRMCNQLNLVSNNVSWFTNININNQQVSSITLYPEWKETFKKLKQISTTKNFVVMSSNTYNIFLGLNLVNDINDVNEDKSGFFDSTYTLHDGLIANPVDGARGYLFNCNIIINDDIPALNSSLLFGTNKTSQPLVSIVYNTDEESKHEISATFKKNSVTFKMYYKIIIPLENITNQYILVN